MAYLRELYIPRCAAHGCGRRASYGIYGERNELLGDYCVRHAHQALRALLERGAEEAKRKTPLQEEGTS